MRGGRSLQVAQPQQLWSRGALPNNTTLLHWTQAHRHTCQQREQRCLEKHVLVVAELEEHAARQRAALTDLARTAEALARENTELHSQLAAVQVGAMLLWREHVCEQHGSSHEKL